MTHWWPRLGAVSGLVAALLAAISRLLLTNLPDTNASLQTLYAYFPANMRKIEVAELLAVWSGLLLLVFAWHIWLRLRPDDGGLGVPVLGGAGGFVAIIWIQAGTLLGLANAGGPSDGGIRVLYTMEQVLNPVALFPAALFLAALALTVLVGRELPTWLALPAGILAAALLIAGSVALFSRSFTQSPVVLVLYLLVALWIAIASALITVGVWSGQDVTTGSSPVPVG